jgi:leader peptidase (prepilin peptidase)/N-methyltransferase
MLGAALLVGALGALVGSFLNVVIHRLPRGESVISPRSRCPACGIEIRPRDNVPVLSWLALRGRCRACGAGISARYPVVEVATAAAFAACAAVRGVDADLLLELPFVAMLVAVAAIDLDLRIVPNRILAPAAAFALPAALILRPGDLPELLVAGAAAFALLLAAALVRPGGMGMGDVKLAGVMGLFLGVAVAPALFVAFLAGSVAGLVVISRVGVSGRKVAVPFAPFLAAGGLVGLLAGPELVNLYVERLL